VARPPAASWPQAAAAANGCQAAAEPPPAARTLARHLASVTWDVPGSGDGEAPHRSSASGAAAAPSGRQAPQCGSERTVRPPDYATEDALDSSSWSPGVRSAANAERRRGSRSSLARLSLRTRYGGYQVATAPSSTLQLPRA